jgi:hypothetical protein
MVTRLIVAIDVEHGAPGVSDLISFGMPSTAVSERCRTRSTNYLHQHSTHGVGRIYEAKCALEYLVVNGIGVCSTAAGFYSNRRAN